MPYLGREGQFGIRERFQYLASAGDTSVSGADANGITMTFDDGLYIDVFLNGVKLKAGEDYNTNTANTIAGITALDANDEIEVIAYDAFTVADTVSAADGGTFSGAVTMSGALSVTGATTVTGGISGTLNVNDTTEATSATDGSLQTDGGLSVVKDAVFGDDVKLLSDSSVISFGADSDVTLTHNADEGLTLSAGANKTALTLISTDGDDNAAPKLHFKRDSASPADSDNLAMINFYGDNDAGEEVIYGRLFVTALDVSDGTEDGRITIQTMRNGTQSTGVLLDTYKIDLTAANINIGGDAHITDECVVANERAATYIIRAYDSDDNLNFAVREVGYFHTGGDTYSPYNYTTTQAANGNISSGGYLRRSTSSLRFKTEVTDIADDWADKLLELKPIFFKSTASGDVEDNDPSWTYYGFGAEDVVKVDPRYVHLKTHDTKFDKEGNETKTKLDEALVEGVQYDRMVPALINIIKRLNKRVETLESKVKTLEDA